MTLSPLTPRGSSATSDTITAADLAISDRTIDLWIEGHLEEDGVQQREGFCCTAGGVGSIVELRSKISCLSNLGMVLLIGVDSGHNSPRN